MFIYIDPDLEILFEKLTTQIGAWPSLGTQPPFEAPSNIGLVRLFS